MFAPANFFPSHNHLRLSPTFAHRRSIWCPDRSGTVVLAYRGEKGKRVSQLARTIRSRIQESHCLSSPLGVPATASRMITFFQYLLRWQEYGMYFILSCCLVGFGSSPISFRPSRHAMLLIVWHVRSCGSVVQGARRFRWTSILSDWPIMIVKEII